MHTPFEPIFAFIRSMYGEETGEIHLHQPLFGPEEEEAVLHCLRTTDVAATGEYVSTFEKLLTDYSGARHAVACVNGTAALHLALIALGIGAGDVILTQALTFVATRNAIFYSGAEPLFLDIEADQLSLDPVLLRSWLERNTVQKAGQTFLQSDGRRVAACLPVHTFGIPARIKDIALVCQDFGIPLIEDAAEALGSFYEKKHCGTFGEAGILSFNGNKLITTGGGGALITDDQALAERVRHLSTQAKQAHPYEYVHDAIGYNYRMPNINAAIGCAQMKKLTAKLASKKALGAAYEDFFSSRPEEVIKTKSPLEWNYWLNSILLKDALEKDLFITEAHRNGIRVRPAWKPVHRDAEGKPIGMAPLPLDRTEDIYLRLVNLPSSPPDEKNFYE